MSIYLDCSMGAAGDMLGAALYELLDETQKASFIKRFNGLFGAHKITLSAQKTLRCGIKGTHFCVDAVGEKEACGHHDEHCQDKNHHHTTMASIEKIVNGLDASKTVKEHIIEVYRLIAEAESEAHGVRVEEVHFHEVGAMDAIADISAFTMLLEVFNYPRVTSSAVNAGSGFVHCAHGTLPVPAPAAASLLKGIPFYKSAVEAELTTPTGAALLRHFASAFGTHDNIVAQKIGYGMGTRELEICNCVRAFLCKDFKALPANDDAAADNDMLIDDAAILECEIDDMTGEEISFAIERLLEEGALDAHTAPVYMKKMRPGVALICISRPCDKEKMASFIFRLTTTLGIRVRTSCRYVLRRNISVKDDEGKEVRIKTASGYGVNREKAEADDIARIAREKGISFREASALIARR